MKLYSSRLTWPCDSPNGPLGFHVFGVDRPFDHELGFGGDQEVDRLRADDVDRAPDDAARHTELVDAEGDLLRRAICDRGRAADDDRHLQPVSAFPAFPPMVVAALAEIDEHLEAQPVGRLELAPVGAHILHPGVRIGGDAAGRGQIGRRVVAGGRDRHRDRIEPAPIAQRLAGQHDILAGCYGDAARRDRVAHRPLPGLADLVDGNPHADRIDRRVGRERADRDREVVAAPVGVDHVGEQERLAVGFRQAAAELPADQRVEHGILVHLAVDPVEQTGRVERREMVLEIGVAALVPAPIGIKIRFGRHCPPVGRNSGPSWDAAPRPASSLRAG